MTMNRITTTVGGLVGALVLDIVALGGFLLMNVGELLSMTAIMSSYIAPRVEFIDSQLIDSATLVIATVAVGTIVGGLINELIKKYDI